MWLKLSPAPEVVILSLASTHVADFLSQSPSQINEHLATINISIGNAFIASFISRLVHKMANIAGTIALHHCCRCFLWSPPLPLRPPMSPRLPSQLVAVPAVRGRVRIYYCMALLRPDELQPDNAPSKYMSA